MLEDLTIKDFALIDNARLEFESGFTVFSGETGAGKSLLIGALTFLLGGKVSASLVRAGANEATVSGTFFLDGASDALEWLEQHGISDEDGRILIRRFVRASGKSGSWIGSVPVTRAELSEFCSYLVDIHGQHEHQNLMKVAEHRKYLDSYAGLTEKVKDFSILFKELSEKKEKLATLIAESEGRAERMELLSFAIKEITDASLRDGEDEELLDEENRLSSFEKLFAEVETVCASLDGENGALSAIKKARSSVNHAYSIDRSLEILSQRLDSAFYELDDISNEFQNYFRTLTFDPARLSAVQERQTLLFNLKKKYATSTSSPISEVISYLSDAQEKLSKLDGNEENQEQLREEIAAVEKKVLESAKEISLARKDAAAKMSAEVVKILSKLGMANTRFLVSVKESKKIGAFGNDDVEFLISANPGQPLQPLAKIASGGELSRVMLSLKTILASSDIVGTMIFDEIDTGIGGEVAVSIGSHLKRIAKTRQVLCITHLASIAVYADNQIKIKKAVLGGSTTTTAQAICGEKRVEEIARMLSGDAQETQSLEHARAMLEKFSGGKK